MEDETRSDAQGTAVCRTRHWLTLLWLGSCAWTLQAQTAHFSGVQSIIPATSLSNVHGVAVDAAGNVYIADSGNNRVLIETLANGSYTQSVLASNFNSPRGLAVDTAGNVYVADTLNHQVVKETLSGNSYTASTLVNGLSSPTCIALDANGNLYIADPGSNRVVLETLSGGTYTSSTIGTGFNSPNGLAVDVGGNVYIADTLNNRVVLETPSNGIYTATTIGSGLSSPAGVAVDASGNLYVADFGSSRVFKETASGGTYTQSVVGSGMSSPYGIVVDAGGAVFVANKGSDQVLRLTTTAGDFGSIAAAATSSPVTLIFTFDTAGTLASTPYLVSTRGTNALDFADAGGGSCMASAGYAAGATCTVNVKFTPRVSGARYGGVSLAGSANIPIASGYVMGTGTGPQVAFLPYTQTVVTTAVNAPRGLAVDESGSIFVADTNNQRVVRLGPSGGSYTQSVFTTSSLSFPLVGVVGGSGNFYLADTYHSRILNEVWTGSSYIEKVVISTGLDYPSGVAVDSSGNVYIADRGNGSSDLGHIYKETLSGTNTYVQSTIPFTGLSGPQSVALDAAGNLYVASTTNNLIFKGVVSPLGFAQSTVTTSSLNHPKLSIDPWGNLYIADVNNNRVLKETVSGSGFIESAVGTGLYQPNSAVGDALGNVLIADTGNNRVLKLDVADAPFLSFPATYVGDASSSQTVTLENIGNASLALLVPATGLNPSVTTHFTLAGGGGSSCPQLSALSSVASLSAGSTCLLPISFTPLTTGTLTGSLTATNNALNSPSGFETIALAGAGLAPDTTSVTLSASPNPVTAVGILTLQAGVSDTLNTGAVPTGAIAFTETYNGSTTALNSGSAVSLAGGAASVTWTATGPGVHALSASYGGTHQFAAGVSSTSVTVNAAAPSLSFATIPTKTYGVAPFFVSATSASGGAVTYAVSSGPATILGSLLTITGAGTVVLSAVQVASGDYTTASASASFMVAKTAISIVFTTSLNPSIYGDTIKLLFAFTGPGIVPTGEAILLDGATKVTTLSLDSSGSASFVPPFSIADARSHAYTVSYSGDANYF